MARPLTRSALALRLVLAIGGLGVVSACQWLVGLAPSPEDAPVPVDAGADVDAADAGPPRPPQACDNPVPGPPNRPVVNDQVPTLTFVLSGASFNGDDAGVEFCPVVGFNLDDRTTCIDDHGENLASPCMNDAGCASSCVPAAGARVCDGPQGVDNALGLLVGDRGAISVLNEMEYRPSSLVASGATNVIITLTGYNGEADDPDVSLASYFSTGLEDRAMSRTEGDAGEPGWDGRTLRRWTVDPGSLDPTGFPSLGQFAGYVTNHVLVVLGAHLQIPFGPLHFDVYDGRLTGELRRRTDGLFNIEHGRVGGRVSTSQVVDVIARAPFQRGSGVVHLCEQGEIGLAGIRNFLCGRADLVADGGANAHCSDISLGLGYNAVPAIKGRLRDRDLSALGCPDQHFDGCQ